jgi:hypothetical protein
MVQFLFFVMILELLYDVKLKGLLGTIELFM